MKYNGRCHAEKSPLLRVDEPAMYGALTQFWEPCLQRRCGPFGTKSVDQERKTIVDKELFGNGRGKEHGFQNQTDLVFTQT